MINCEGSNAHFSVASGRRRSDEPGSGRGQMLVTEIVKADPRMILVDCEPWVERVIIDESLTYSTSDEKASAKASAGVSDLYNHALLRHLAGNIEPTDDLGTHEIAPHENPAS